MSSCPELQEEILHLYSLQTLKRILKRTAIFHNTVQQPLFHFFSEPRLRLSNQNLMIESWLHTFSPLKRNLKTNQQTVQSPTNLFVFVFSIENT